jgi:glycosyltransferase involved in cell wall biosynthesis
MTPQQRSDRSGQVTFPDGDGHAQPGALDGMTIMRYAHIYRDRRSGGVEQYLRLLDQALLQRHRLTVLQVYLTTDERNDVIEIQNVGLGRILWVPVAMRQSTSILSDLPKRVGQLYRRALKLSRVEAKGQSHAIMSSIRNLVRHNAGHFRYRTMILSDHLCRILETHHVNLLALHWSSYETGDLIACALKRGIPFVFVNHFDNGRLSSGPIRTWIAHAEAIGTVSDQGVPSEFRDRYVNLSDAIDINFFSPMKAVAEQSPARPIILLPARVEVGKGHRDLLKAARVLNERGVQFDLWFAGAVESQRLQRELLSSVAAIGMGKNVCFLGEKTPEQIRDCYATSSIVVLPTYSEGLGRVVLEAQAMNKPVVAYECGGTPDALLPDQSGFLVKKGDVLTLANKLNFLLTNEEERRRMGDRGREFVSRKFGLSGLVQRHEAFYMQALAGRSVKVP